MKKLFIIILWLIGITLNAATYYVATTGNNSASGDITHPWLTWQKAFNEAVEGDTVFFRGGVYYTTAWNYLVNSGTYSHPICFFNYPGEVPILDGINKSSPSSGIGGDNIDNIYFKGLHVRWNRQIQVDSDNGIGFDLWQCNNIRFENCKSYNNGMRGWYLNECDTVYLINCDAYNNCDSLTSDYPGGGGDGFIIWDNGGAAYQTSYAYLKGCRAWHNSDDGYDIETEGLIEVDSCWSFSNGYLDGDGGGFKYGKQNRINAIVTRKITHSLAFHNSSHGFDQNIDDKYMNEEIYNNTSYHNDDCGFIVYTVSGTPLNNYYRNNISYANVTNFAEYGPCLNDHNSWDLAVTVTNADFISIDSSGVTGARQADGSLPELNYLKLASNSDLIDKGVDVGLDYTSSAPDLGYFEYEAQVPAVNPTVITVTSLYPNVTYALVTSAVTDDGGGTVSARGVCWGTSANPTTAGSKTTNGTGDGSFNSTLTPLLPNTTYHARAYATNEAGTSYSADETFQTLKEEDKLIVSSGGKVVTYQNKVVVNQSTNIGYDQVEYGLLYNHYAVTDARNICSSGWRIPKKSDWIILYTYIGTDYFADKVRQSGNYWVSGTVGATNEYRFNSRGSSSRSQTTGLFYNLGQTHNIWISDSTIGDYGINYGKVEIFYNYHQYSSSYSSSVNYRNMGCSLRPVKITTTLTHGQTGTYTGNDGKVYRTICIGTQEWVADNLAETKYRDGTDIPIVTDNGSWIALTTGAVCAYNNDWSYVMIE